MTEVTNQELIDVANEIRESFNDATLDADLDKALKGNAAAAIRVRNRHLAIGQLFKSFRKLSLEAGLKH